MTKSVSPRAQRKAAFDKKRSKPIRKKSPRTEPYVHRGVNGRLFRNKNSAGQTVTTLDFHGHEFESKVMAIAYVDEFMDRLAGRRVTHDVYAMIAEEAYHNFRDGRGNVVHPNQYFTDGAGGRAAPPGAPLGVIGHLVAVARTLFT